MAGVRTPGIRLPKMRIRAPMKRGGYTAGIPALKKMKVPTIRTPRGYK